ncbi:MAG: ATP-dependent sacrificial sulfur transferase LarE [Clostridia bacterium]|nr:ATP-dependent sacrificial sulfur transferase LarE [Clostridia bacterium]
MIDGALTGKYDALGEYLSSLGSVAVAYSAGVDSTFLLRAARDALGGGAVAVTVKHPAFPERELGEARGFCRAEGIRQIVVSFDPLAVDGFSENPPDRCYICKKAIFRRIVAVAAENGIRSVADGSNADDGNDYRPGMRALSELGVISPLRAVGLTKAEIRALSEKLGLPTWDKPSYACLATRIPHGEEITGEKLSMIGRAEDVLFGLGFRQSRVRCHGAVARIELEDGDFEKMNDPGVRAEVAEKLKGIGFSFVSLDLCGYRAGNMNPRRPTK